MSTEPLRVFVAMPGSNMGKTAAWQKPEEIKKHFFEEIAKTVGQRLKRKVRLVVEKDKPTPGEVHPSMFAEASKSDVFIADLTGANPNVYLELGVRWAVRDNVTVVVCQSLEDIRFNAKTARAVLYAKDPDELQKAVATVVAAVVEGLAEPSHCDSPVRRGAVLAVYERAFVDAMSKDNEELRLKRGDDLMQAALSSTVSTERVRLLREVVNLNPARPDARVALAGELRKQGEYDDALSCLEPATRGSAPPDVYREQGVLYGKKGELGKAVAALREAVRLGPDDAETLCNLGGALRRQALNGGPRATDWALLDEARRQYSLAAEIKENDSYALLNVAKASLLLSRGRPPELLAAQKEFKTLIPLCEFLVSQAQTDYWRLFDLADARFFSGQWKKGRSTYQKALGAVPAEYRKSVCTSVGSVLEEVRSHNVLPDAAKSELRSVVADLKRAVSAVKP